MLSPKSIRFFLTLSIGMMLFGVMGAGLTYRNMRKQRLLHEPVRVFKLDPSRPCGWQSAPLPVYRDGPHALFFSLSAKDTGIFHGMIDIVIEDPQGHAAYQMRGGSFATSLRRPDRLWWFPLDTLFVKNISSSEWKIQTRILTGDPACAGSLAELVVIPPSPEDFAPYLEENAYKLYGSGIAVVAGFFLMIFAGRNQPEGTMA